MDLLIQGGCFAVNLYFYNKNRTTMGLIFVLVTGALTAVALSRYL
jgi:hypothetical protein